MTRDLTEMARWMHKQTDKPFEECLAMLTAIPPDELERIITDGEKLTESLREAWARGEFDEQVGLPPGRRP